MKESWRQLTPSQQAELENLIPGRGWRVLPGRELPSVFPASFRSKLDSALIIAEPTDTGGTYLVTSAVRVDFTDMALDHEPFGLIVHSTGADSYGVFVHHGAWEERTVHPPDTLWEGVSSTGIGDYFLAVPPSGKLEGSLEDLPAGHRGAFDTVVQALRKHADEGRAGC